MNTLATRHFLRMGIQMGLKISYLKILNNPGETSMLQYHLQLWKNLIRRKFIRFWTFAMNIQSPQIEHLMDSFSFLRAEICWLFIYLYIFLYAQFSKTSRCHRDGATVGEGILQKEGNTFRGGPWFFTQKPRQRCGRGPGFVLGHKLVHAAALPLHLPKDHVAPRDPRGFWVTRNQWPLMFVLRKKIWWFFPWKKSMLLVVRAELWPLADNTYVSAALYRRGI